MDWVDVINDIAVDVSDGVDVGEGVAMVEVAVTVCVGVDEPPVTGIPADVGVYAATVCAMNVPIELGSTVGTPVGAQAWMITTIQTSESLRKVLDIAPPFCSPGGRTEA